jgi:hypothetical protein
VTDVSDCHGFSADPSVFDGQIATVTQPSGGIGATVVVANLDGEDAGAVAKDIFTGWGGVDR